MVSIIIVNFNTKDLTLACLTSIYKFSPKEEFEVIVIDNGSSDGSLEKLRENRNITLIEADKNLGFAKGNNLGIKKAKGEYVLLLNSDTEVKKDSIQNLIDFAKRTPDAGAVASRLLNIDGSFQASIFRFPTVERAIKQYKEDRDSREAIFKKCFVHFAMSDEKIFMATKLEDWKTFRQLYIQKKELHMKNSVKSLKTNRS